MAKRKKKISEKQLKANRENAQKSPGPKTDEGKKASSLNAGKHFGYSQQGLLPGENETEYESIYLDLFNIHHPKTLYEMHLIKRIRDIYWRLSRILNYEALIWLNPSQYPEPFRILNQLSLIESRMEKQLRQAEKTLLDTMYLREQVDLEKAKRPNRYHPNHTPTSTKTAAPPSAQTPSHPAPVSPPKTPQAPQTASENAAKKPPQTQLQSGSPEQNGFVSTNSAFTPSPLTQSLMAQLQELLQEATG